MAKNYQHDLDYLLQKTNPDEIIRKTGCTRLTLQRWVKGQIRPSGAHEIKLLFMLWSYKILKPPVPLIVTLSQMIVDGGDPTQIARSVGFSSEQGLYILLRGDSSLTQSREDTINRYIGTTNSGDSATLAEISKILAETAQTLEGAIHNTSLCRSLRACCATEIRRLQLLVNALSSQHAYEQLRSEGVFDKN